MCQFSRVDPRSGFEPELTEPESVVLPLHYRGNHSTHPTKIKRIKDHSDC